MYSKKLSVSTFAFIFTALTFGSFANNAHADTVRCDYRQWRGAPDTVAISWLGLGFEAQENQSVIRLIHDAGRSDWINADVRRASGFTSYVIYSQDRYGNNSSIRSRYSFRIYDRGNCEARVEHMGYLPILADGSVQD